MLENHVERLSCEGELINMTGVIISGDKLVKMVNFKLAVMRCEGKFINMTRAWGKDRNRTPNTSRTPSALYLRELMESKVI